MRGIAGLRRSYTRSSLIDHGRTDGLIPLAKKLALSDRHIAPGLANIGLRKCRREKTVVERDNYGWRGS